jgi:hypothetical protein
VQSYINSPEAEKHDFHFYAAGEIRVKIVLSGWQKLII